jgi:predicted transcriptional regulator
MRLVVQLSDEVHKRLIEYVQRRYKGKHGSLSWVAEEAIEKFLNEEAKREKREAS